MEQLRFPAPDIIQDDQYTKDGQRRIFSNNFNRLLAEKGKTQGDVFNALKTVKRQTVSAWSCGKAVPHMDKIEALARFFNVEKSELLEPDYNTEYADITKKIRKLNATGMAQLNSYLDFLLMNDNNKELL